MSSTDETNARAIAREAATIIKGTAARLSGKKRGRDHQVRRDSYDVADRRAQVFRRVEDGSRAAGLGWIEDLVDTAERYDLTHRKKGQRGPLQASGVRVLKFMLSKHLRFDTGQLDPAVRTIAEGIGYTYKCVHAALKRLRAHGFLGWVRRSRKIEDADGAGPRREQVSNAYHFALGELPKRVLMHWRNLRERRRRRLAASTSRATPAALPSLPPSKPSPLAAALASLGSTLAERESPTG